MSFSGDIVKDLEKHYINNEFADGYTWAALKSKYPEAELEKTMRRINGWNRHHQIVDEWAHRGRGGHGRY